MDEAKGETVLVTCPECGEDEQEVVRAAASSWVLRCATCGFTRTVPAPRRERLRRVPLILSEGPTATQRELDVPLDGPVRVGDEYELDGHRIRVTAMERPDGTRPNESAGRDLRVLYAIVFDTVRIAYTLNQGEVTRSLAEEVAPEEEIHIGSVREVQGVRIAVKTLKSDQNRTIHRGFLLARNVRRAFADLAPTGKHPGAKVRTRERGRAAGVERRKLQRRKGPVRRK